MEDSHMFRSGARYRGSSTQLSHSESRKNNTKPFCPRVSIGTISSTNFGSATDPLKYLCGLKYVEHS